MTEKQPNPSHEPDESINKETKPKLNEIPEDSAEAIKHVCYTREELEKLATMPLEEQAKIEDEYVAKVKDIESCRSCSFHYYKAAIKHQDEYFSDYYDDIGEIDEEEEEE